tara:strand:- start:1458 stop:1847 length:390 start_codon:yes stop_codon:yes gene_type:complete
MLYAVAIVLLVLSMVMCYWYMQCVKEDPAAFGKSPVDAPPVEEEEEVLDFLPPYVVEIHPKGWAGAKATVAKPGKTLPREEVAGLEKRNKKVTRPCRKGRLSDKEIVDRYRGDWITEDPIADGFSPGHD